MKKIYLLLMLLAGYSLPGHAQFKQMEPRDLSQIKGHILLVALQDEDTHTLIKYQHMPTELKIYQDAIAKINSYFKDAFTQNYKYSKSIEFQPESKAIRTMKSPAGSKYVLLQLRKEGSFKPDLMSDFYGKGDYTEDIRKASKAEGTSQLVVSMMNNSKEMVEIYTVQLPVAYPSETDIIYAAGLMQYEFTRYAKIRDYKVDDLRTDAVANNAILKRRTLLIDQAQISGKTTQEELQADYPYKLQVVDYSKIQQAVKAHDSSYAYVQVVQVPPSTVAVNSGKTTMLIEHVVVDAKDEKVLSRARPTRTLSGKPADDISRKELKEYLDPR